MNIPSKAARRQTEICIALVRELDRAVTELKQPADQYLAHFYRRRREYGSRDRRFLSDAVFSWFRWRGWLKTPEQENIAAAILLDADKIPPQLEYFGLQLLKADLKPAGRLTIEEKAAYLLDLLNSPFRQNDPVGRDSLSRRLFGRTGPRGPTSLKFPSLELFPPWFPDFIFIPEKMERELHFNQCIQAFQSRPPTWLRLPSGGEEHAFRLLAQAGYEIERHPLFKQAVFIKAHLDSHFHGNDSKELSVQNLHIRNVNSQSPGSFDASRFPQIQLQDLASQCVGLCCKPAPDEHWWDMCAGAGGKSLHLADLMRDKGSILATDIRPEILNQLSKRLRQNKYQSIRPLLWDGKSEATGSIFAKPEKYFDGVLVDAPCSGIGTWHRNPDARGRMDAGQIAEYARVQKNLLEIAAGKVKPGGKMVYSTCTLTKTENIEVITAFLEENHQFQLEKLINPLNREPANGIIWIWPWEGNCNGMFIAVMKKT